MSLEQFQARVLRYERFSERIVLPIALAVGFGGMILLTLLLGPYTKHLAVFFGLVIVVTIALLYGMNAVLKPISRRMGVVCPQCDWYVGAKGNNELLKKGCCSHCGYQVANQPEEPR